MNEELNFINDRNLRLLIISGYASSQFLYVISIEGNIIEFT